MKTNLMGPVDESVSGLKTQEMGPVLSMPVDEFEKLVKTVMILIPHRVDWPIAAPLTQAMAMWARWGAVVGCVPDNFGGFIEIQRAGMVRTFLDFAREHPDIDKLVMIDSDENVPYDSPFRLAYWDLPVVSGVVCTYSETRGIFACFTVKDENGVARFPSYNFTKKMPGRGLIEAHSVGTGLICIQKAVLEKIYDSNMVPFYVPEKERLAAAEGGMLKWGEDIAFCRQCEEVGFKRYVDLSVQAVHYKTMPVSWPRVALDYEIDPLAWKVNPKDYRHG